MCHRCLDTLRCPEGAPLWADEAQVFHTNSCFWLKQPHKINFLIKYFRGKMRLPLTFLSFSHFPLCWFPIYGSSASQVRQAPDDCEDFLIWSNDNEPQALFFVQRFYSRTNSFVKIEPMKEQLSCHQQRRIKVHYVLNRDGYRNARHTNFYYVVNISFLLSSLEHHTRQKSLGQTVVTDHSLTWWPLKRLRTLLKSNDFVEKGRMCFSVS